jgi:hypothetical protein
MIGIIPGIDRLFDPRRHELEIEKIGRLNGGRRHDPLLRQATEK